MQNTSGLVDWRRLTLVRLGLFMFVLFGMLTAWQIFVIPAVQAAPGAWRVTAMAGMAFGFCAIMLASYWGLVRWLEQRTAHELSLRTGASWFCLGVVAGTTLFCVVYALLWAMGIAHWQGIAGFDGIPVALSGAAMAAVGEELLVRGGIFRLTEEAFGTTIALIVSAALFGAGHAFQPGANLISVTAIALEAGILLGAAFAASRSLWLPIGLHFAWNFTEGGIFGAAVSGGRSHGVFLVNFSGHDLWTGGRFGPEASPVAIACCLVLASVFIVHAVRKGRWYGLRFNMYASRPA